MLKLSDKRFSDYLRQQRETGMGYWVVTAHLKDGRSFPQVVVSGGQITRVRGYGDIPFRADDIDTIEVTHDKWDWAQDK